MPASPVSEDTLAKVFEQIVNSPKVLASGKTYYELLDVSLPARDQRDVLETAAEAYMDASIRAAFLLGFAAGRNQTS